MEKPCQCVHPPIGEEFTAEQWAKIDEIINRYRGQPGVLIPVLEDVQDYIGYLPESIQRRVAKGLGVPLAQVYGVVTFYSFFTMTPKGKYPIRVCLGTACQVRGSHRVLEELENDLAIEPGGCTEDRQFSLEVVRCLGACGLAPVMVVGDDTHKQVKAVKVESILKRYCGNGDAGQGDAK